MEIPVKITGLSTRATYDPGAAYNLVNLALKNGALAPVTPRLSVKQLPVPYSYIYIHKTGLYEHWLGVLDGNVYYFADQNGDITPVQLAEVSGSVSMTGIGNVVNVISGSGIVHLVWYQSEYKLITSSYDGDQDSAKIGFLAPVNLRMNLSDSKPIVYRSESEVSNDPYPGDDVIIETVKGLYVKAASAESSKGYPTGFMMACVAFELYDGSIIMHQSPVILCQTADTGSRYDIPFGNYISRPLVSYYSDIAGINYETISASPGGTQEYSVDEYNSHELTTAIYYPLAPASPRIVHRGGNKENDQNVLKIYPKPSSLTTTYWTVLADDSDPDWETLIDGVQEYSEQFEDVPAGTKFVYWEYADAVTVINYLVERTSTTYELVASPNLVGYKEVGIPNSYINVITRRSNIQFKINESINQNLAPLVKGVNIYITPQVSMYDPEGEYTTVGAKRTTAVDIKNYIAKIKTNEEIIKELAGQENFYLVKEIPFTEITAGDWINIDLENKLGDNLLVQPRMPIDPLSHHNIVAEKQYVYNSRLHILDYNRDLSRGFPLGYLSYETGSGQFESATIDYDQASITSKIKTETGISVSVRLDSAGGEFKPGPILSYPDSRGIEQSIKLRKESNKSTTITYLSEGIVKIQASDISLVGIGTLFVNNQIPASFEIVEYDQMTGIGATSIQTPESGYDEYFFDYVREYNLTSQLLKHDYQNFAHFISPDIKPIDVPSEGLPIYSQFETPEETQRTQVYENGMKVSSVNNPFNFPLANTYTIGTGKALNMASNALRMSEGQFGQYPLYVFTEGGVYSLQVGTGEVYYTSQAPASLEIPVSDKILETPFGVAFITREGLSIINGQKVDRISPQLEEAKRVMNLDKIDSSEVVSGDTSDPLKIAFIETNINEVLASPDLIMMYNNNEEEILLTTPSLGYTFALRDGNWYISTEKAVQRVEGLGSKLLACRVNESLDPIYEYETATSTGKSYDQTVALKPSGYTMPTIDNIFDIASQGLITINTRIWVYDESVLPGDENAKMYDHAIEQVVEASRTMLADYALYVKAIEIPQYEIIDYSQEGSENQDCALITRPIDFGNKSLKRISRIKIISELIGVTRLYYMNHIMYDQIHGRPITGIYMREEADNYDGPYNIETLDSMRVSIKGRYIVTSLGLSCSRDSRVYSIEYQVDKEYENGKL